MQSTPKRPPLATGNGLVSSHRINAQTLSPSASTCTEAGGPISLPPGSLAHSPPGTVGPPPSASPFTGRYGLSRLVCANAAIANKSSDPNRIMCDMAATVYNRPDEIHNSGVHGFTHSRRDAGASRVLGGVRYDEAGEAFRRAHKSGMVESTHMDLSAEEGGKGVREGLGVLGVI